MTPQPCPRISRAVLGRRRWSFALVALALPIVIAGCQQPAPPPVTATDNADSWLEEVLAHYKKAASYEDAGELHVTFQAAEGEPEESDALPFSVALERPNKLRVHSLRASIVADGRQLRASIMPLEGQVLALPCPPKLTIDAVLGDVMLTGAVRGQIDVLLPQLVLLLDDDPLKTLDATGKPTKLSDEELDGELCHRVSVRGSRGTCVFWIRAADGLLRRFDFPTESLKQRFGLTECVVWADLKGARVDAKIPPDAFAFEVPSDAKLVKRFLPPPPIAPFAAVGQDACGVFVCRHARQAGEPRIAGRQGRGAGSVGHLVRLVLQGISEFGAGVSKVQGQRQSGDPGGQYRRAGHERRKGRGSFAQAHLTIPIVRDAAAIGRKSVCAPGDSLALPTMVVLGPDGTVQEYHLGYDAQLAETLPKKIDQLLAGGNLAQDELDHHAQEQAEYDKQLAEVTVDAGATPADGRIGAWPLSPLRAIAISVNVCQLVPAIQDDGRSPPL